MKDFGHQAAIQPERYRVNREESIIQRKDSFQETANEECPKKARTGRLGPHWLPFLYNLGQAEAHIREGCSKLRKLGICDEWPPKLSGDDADFLAKLFSSFSWTELLKHRKQLPQSFSFPIGANQLIQGRRSRFAIRLRLLWLDFLLVPTRIRYMLRHSFQGPYGKFIITDHETGQRENSDTKPEKKYQI